MAPKAKNSRKAVDPDSTSSDSSVDSVEVKSRKCKLLDVKLQLAKKRMRLVDTLQQKEVEQRKERKRLREEAEQRNEETKRRRVAEEAKKRRNRGNGKGMQQGWSSGGGNYGKGYGGSPWLGKGFQNAAKGNDVGKDKDKAGNGNLSHPEGNDVHKGGSCKGNQSVGKDCDWSADDDPRRWDGDDWGDEW